VGFYTGTVPGRWYDIGSAETCGRPTRSSPAVDEVHAKALRSRDR
jgi:hypothetical protein